MRCFKTNTFGCFSPPVMIATFVIEIALAVYVNWRYRFNNITKLAISILFFLAVFQLAEYNVCEGSFGIDSLSWARVGYVAITMLPPLGFHLATRIAGERRNGMIAAAYGSAALFATFFAFSGQGITSSACLGNYVIFKSAPEAASLYMAYCYGWLVVGTVYSLFMARKVDELNRSGALTFLAIGYLVFIVPTATVTSLDPSTVAGIPSIMCGFAVFMALVLAGEVMPRYFKQQSFIQKLTQSSSAGQHEKT